MGNMAVYNIKRDYRPNIMTITWAFTESVGRPLKRQAVKNLDVSGDGRADFIETDIFVSRV